MSWAKALGDSWTKKEPDGRKHPLRSKAVEEARERAGADPGQAYPLWGCVELMQRHFTPILPRFAPILSPFYLHLPPI